LSGGEYLRQLSDYLDLNEEIVRSSIRRPPGKKPVDQTEGLFLPAEKRLLQILLEDEKLAAELLARAREEDFRGLRSEAALAFLLDCGRKGRRILLPELAKAAGPELSRSITELLQERTCPGSGEEAKDCLQTLRRTALETTLRALSKEIERCERSGEKAKLASLLAQKQALTKKIMSM
jgi:hypothetical protein